jgi:hypothetical protein
MGISTAVLERAGLRVDPEEFDRLVVNALEEVVPLRPSPDPAAELSHDELALLAEGGMRFGALPAGPPWSGVPRVRWRTRCPGAPGRGRPPLAPAHPPRGTGIQVSDTLTTHRRDATRGLYVASPQMVTRVAAAPPPAAPVTAAAPAAPAAAVPLRIRLLGGFDVEGRGSHGLGSRKARTLLKVLALAEGRPVSTDQLIDALWPDGDHPARPEEQVAVLVSRLRAVLGPERIQRSDAGYRLNADWLDVRALGDLAAETSRQLSAGNLAVARAAGMRRWRWLGGRCCLTSRRPPG